MSAKQTQSILSRIRDHYKNLPPAERKLADLLLDFPGDIASYSATELSGLAGVSKAATTRFFKRLGYESFDQARRSSRREQSWGSPLYLMSQKEEGENFSGSLQQEMDMEMQNLAKTYATLDTSYLELTSRQLLSANRVWLLGFRHSYFLAEYARFQFIQIRDDVYPLLAEDSSLAERIVNINKSDIVFAIGFRRRTRRFLQTMKALHNKGIRILYLTEPNVGASINYATWVVTAEVSGTGIFDSYPGACSMIHLLSTSMLAQTDRKIGDRLKQVEVIHSELEDF